MLRACNINLKIFKLHPHLHFRNVYIIQKAKENTRKWYQLSTVTISCFFPFILSLALFSSIMNHCIKLFKFLFLKITKSSIFDQSCIINIFTITLIVKTLESQQMTAHKPNLAHCLFCKAHKPQTVLHF